jgi:hypothetical protein
MGSTTSQKSALEFNGRRGNWSGIDWQGAIRIILPCCRWLCRYSLEIVYGKEHHVVNGLLDEAATCARKTSAGEDDQRVWSPAGALRGGMIAAVIWTTRNRSLAVCLSLLFSFQQQMGEARTVITSPRAVVPQLGSHQPMPSSASSRLPDASRCHPPPFRDAPGLRPRSAISSPRYFSWWS